MQQWGKFNRFAFAFSFISIIFFITPCQLPAASLTLAWDSNDPTPDGYEVFQRLDGETYNYAQPVWPTDGQDHTETACTITDLADDTTYHFVVRAYVGSETSGDSNEVSHHTAAAAPNTYTISVSTGSNGAIAPGGSVTLDEGADQTFSITPDAGYHVADVLVDGQSQGAITSYTFSNLSANHTISASFSANTFTVTASAGSNGSITPPGSVNVSLGGSQTYAITPDAGYQVADVLVDGQSQGALTSYTFSNVSANHSIEAEFAGDPMEKWTLSAQAEMNGTITPEGELLVEHGSSLTFEITPDTNYQVADVFVDGFSMGALDTYTFDNITESHTIIATFIADETKSPVFEFGKTKVDHNWVRVNFKQQYTDPVVVTSPLSLLGSEPAIVRIRNVDSAGFEVRIQEWEYLDGSHEAEILGYLVMERGAYVLPDGTRLEASVFKTDASEACQPVLLEQSYNTIPVVISSVTSLIGTNAVVGRMTDIGIEGFRYCLQEQEANNRIHDVETVAYIACEPTSGYLDDFSFEINKTADVVTHKFHTIQLENGFGADAVFLAAMQTKDGKDTANVRYKNKTSATVDVQIDEEQSRDKETRHTKEVVGYMVFIK